MDTFLFPITLLPPELISIILSHLNGWEVFQARLVCRLFNQVILNAPELHYLIDLHAGNMVNGSWDGTDFALRRRRFHERRIAMLTLDRPLQTVIDVEDLGIDSWRRRFGDGLLDIYGEQRAAFFQLPSEYRGVPPRYWILDNIKVPSIGELATAWDQDAMVVTTREGLQDSETAFYFLTMSEGKPHPLAQVPSIIYSSNVILGNRWGDLQMCGDKVGLLCIDEHDMAEVVMYDWKTGKLLYNAHHTFKGFCFLNNDYAVMYLVVDEDGGQSLDHLQFYLQVINLNTGKICLVLEYPVLLDSSLSEVIFDFKTEYNAVHPCTFGNFHTANNNRIIAATWEDITQGTNLTYLHVIPVSTILGLIPENQSGIKFMEWLQWASCDSATRLFERPSVRGFFFNVHGMKLVVSSEEENSLDVLIYDFHRPSVTALDRQLKEGTLPPLPPGAEWPTCVMGETRIIPTEGRQELMQLKLDDPSHQFYTSLPYSVHRQRIPGELPRAEEIMFGEDGFIWLQNSHPEARVRRPVFVTRSY